MTAPVQRLESFEAARTQLSNIDKFEKVVEGKITRYSQTVQIDGKDVVITVNVPPDSAKKLGENLDKKIVELALKTHSMWEVSSNDKLTRLTIDGKNENHVHLHNGSEVKSFKVKDKISELKTSINKNEDSEEAQVQKKVYEYLNGTSPNEDSKLKKTVKKMQVAFSKKDEDKLLHAEAVMVDRKSASPVALPPPSFETVNNQQNLRPLPPLPEIKQVRPLPALHEEEHHAEEPPPRVENRPAPTSSPVNAEALQRAKDRIAEKRKNAPLASVSMNDGDLKIAKERKLDGLGGAMSKALDRFNLPNTKVDDDEGSSDFDDEISEVAAKAPETTVEEPKRKHPANNVTTTNKKVKSDIPVVVSDEDRATQQALLKQKLMGIRSAENEEEIKS